MKLIIDIPEDIYTRLFDNGIQDNEIAVDDICEMARALRLGTPLDTHDEEIIATTVESIWGKPPYTELLDKIRAEVTAIAINGQVDAHTIFIRTGEQVKQVALEIIDKYKAVGGEG